MQSSVKLKTKGKENGQNQGPSNPSLYMDIYSLGLAILHERSTTNTTLHRKENNNLQIRISAIICI